MRHRMGNSFQQNLNIQKGGQEYGAIEFFHVSTRQIRLRGSPDRRGEGRLWPGTGRSRQTAIVRWPHPAGQSLKTASTARGWPVRARSLPYQREDGRPADHLKEERRHVVVCLRDECGCANVILERKERA